MFSGHVHAVLSNLCSTVHSCEVYDRIVQQGIVICSVDTSMLYCPICVVLSIHVRFMTG